MIVVAGNSAAEEGEYVYADMEELYVKSMGGDRTQGIALPTHDREILSAVAQVRQDAIVVLVGGSSFTMEDWIGQTGALLMAYYPGMEGGHALADVLFGKENPGGKTAVCDSTERGRSAAGRLVCHAAGISGAGRIS